MEAVLTLKPGREKSILRGHPWIFSGAVQKLDGQPQTGETLKLVSAEGAFLARAAYSPASQIRARIWSWEPAKEIDNTFFAQQLQKAITNRKELIEQAQSNAYRLVNAESDGLPGLVVDQYNEVLVVQLLSAGPEFWRETILDLLEEITGIHTIYERSDVEVRRLEGLDPRTGLARGDHLPGAILLEEHGIRYKIDIADSQKTGFYLDQRSNRLKLRNYAKQKLVLDCFSFSGGFTLNALQAGAAHVTAIDSSSHALNATQENIHLNSFDRDRVDLIEANVFDQLRSFRDARKSFDLIVLDPPKFAPTKKQVARALKAYKDINLLAFKLLNPGGVLFSFSCSGGVDPALFQKVVAGAALDAGVNAQILEYLAQDKDHPVGLNYPEGAYLKGLVCKIS